MSQERNEKRKKRKKRERAFLERTGLSHILQAYSFFCPIAYIGVLSSPPWACLGIACMPSILKWAAWSALMYYSDPEPYKRCQKVELSSPLQVHLWMWCDIVIMGESISGFLIRWTCLAQIKATSRLRSQHMWPMWGELGLTLTLHAGGRARMWLELKAHTPLSSRTNCGDALPSWSGWKQW